MGGEEKLANAIVVQAATDYADAFWGKRVDGKYAAAVMDECERFFHSGWYGELTTVDGDFLIKNIKIQELEKTIGVYKEILSVSRHGSIKLVAAKTKEKPGINYTLPPRLADTVERTLHKQLKELEAELNELKER